MAPSTTSWDPLSHPLISSTPISISGSTSMNSCLPHREKQLCVFTVLSTWKSTTSSLVTSSNFSQVKMLRKLSPTAEETAQSVRCLLNKHDHLNLIPRTHAKKPGMILFYWYSEETCPFLDGDRRGGDWGVEGRNGGEGLGGEDAREAVAGM